MRYGTETGKYYKVIIGEWFNQRSKKKLVNRRKISHEYLPRRRIIW